MTTSEPAPRRGLSRLEEPFSGLVAAIAATGSRGYPRSLRGVVERTENQGAVSLLARVGAALASDDAEAGLRRALDVLRAAGIAAAPEGGDAWLDVRVGARRVALRAEREPKVSELRTALEGMLRCSLARVAEGEALRRVSERAEMLSSASFEGLFVHVDGEVIEANQQLLDLLRCERSDVMGAGIAPWCVAAADMPLVRQRIGERIEGAYVITGVRKDGTRFRAELQSKQGRLGDRPVRVVAVRDVTERERTARLLEEGEERLRELAKKAFDFVTIVRKGVFVHVSEGVEHVLGFKPEEVVGLSVLELAAPSARAQASRVLAEGRTGAFELLALAKDGQEVPISIVAAETTLGGEPVRMGAVRDLREARRREAERRQLEDQLQRGKRLESLGVLAGGIAHDFNNLLVGMIGNAELLFESLSGPENRELCSAIVSAARRASDLTSQLLVYAGRGDLEPRELVDLSALWSETFSLVAARLSAGVRLERELSPDCVVRGNRPTLTQVFMNLLTNASDAIEEGQGTIRIVTRRVVDPDARWQGALGARVGPGNWVLSEVSDSGVGMSSETLQRIFEPFFTTKHRGHGLGLASCLGIVSAHGGAVLVDSALGRGTRFSVIFPEAGAVAKAEFGPTRQPSGGGRRVLVVDDEPVVRSLIRRALERAGYSVVEASGGEAGWTAIIETRPDLLVLDLNMPDVDGAELLRRVRMRGFDVPVVLVSGHLDAAMERRLASLSYQRFLPKPFSVTELISTVADVIQVATRARG